MSQPDRVDLNQPPPQRRNCLTIGVLAAAVLMVLIGGLAVLSFLLLPVLMERMASKRGETGHEGASAVGRKLPDLQLQPLTGESQAVALGDLQGKVVLVDFWGTWCPPCRAELPHLAETTAKFAGHPDFQFLAVSCGPGGTDDPEQLRDATETFLQQAGLKIPTYSDPGFKTRSAYDRVGELQGYPTTFLLDRRGVIRHVWVGFDPRISGQLESLIPKLLAEGEAKK